MGEFKGTKGPVDIVEHSWSDTSVVIHDVAVCRLSIYNEATEETQDQLEDIMSANAELIRDAFNVRQKINFDLPELLQQRNELYDALQAIVCNIDNWLETGVPADPELSKMLYDAAKKAIARGLYSHE